MRGDRAQVESMGRSCDGGEELRRRHRLGVDWDLKGDREVEKVSGFFSEAALLLDLVVSIGDEDEPAAQN